MTDYEFTGGGQTSAENMRRFLDTRRIEGVDVDLKLDHDESWDLPYESFGFPTGNVKYAVKHVGINPRDWLKVCQSMHPGTESETIEEWRDSAYGPTVESVAEDIQNGDTNDIPTPVLEIDTNYEGNHAEGRSRGYGALEAGLDYMPLWIAARDYY